MTRHDNPGRRKVLKGIAATGAAAGVTGVFGRIGGVEAGGKGRGRRLERNRQLGLTATEAVDAMTTGTMSAESYAAVLLSRVESLDPLNLFIYLDRDHIMEAARAADQARASGAALGPLHGLPIGLKDLLNTDFAPTTGGTPALAGNIPANGNAELTDILLGAGAIAFGKTNMHELSFGATSENAYTGAVGNPYNPAMIAGGSSGGSAAGVAARVFPAGIGGDTAGSVRIPASLCGVCGLRPTSGEWPGSPETVVPISDTRDTLGPIARSCHDIELLNRVVAGTDPIGDGDLDGLLDGLRLGVDPQFFPAGFDADVAAVTQDALADLEAAGVELVDVALPNVAAFMGPAGFDVMLFEVVVNLKAYLAANTSLTLLEVVDQIASPDVSGLFASILPPGGTPVPAAAHAAGLVVRANLLAEYQTLFASAADIDALVFPTTVVPATPIGNAADIFTYIHNTDGGSFTGLPGLSLPIGLTGSGLPVGLGLDGPPNSDRALIAMGMAMERQVFGRLKAPSI